jgi:hypothetical protein
MDSAHNVHTIDLLKCMDEFIACTGHSITSAILIENLRDEIYENPKKFPTLGFLLRHAISVLVYRYDGPHSAIIPSECMEELYLCHAASKESNPSENMLVGDFVMYLSKNRRKYPMLWALLHYDPRPFVHYESMDAIGKGQ